MLIWENIILAINSLLSNKMRALLTMLGIIIGIGSVIAIITVGNSLTLSVSENMQSMGANDVYLMLEQKTEGEEASSKTDGIRFGSYEQTLEMKEEDFITEEMVQEMCDQFSDEIYAINVEQSCGSGEVVLDNHSASVTLTGTSAGYYITNKLNLLGGRMFSEQDYGERKKVALVSDKVIEKIFDGNSNLALGKEIEINAGGKSDHFTIIGVYEYENPGMMMMGGEVSTNVYIPLRTAMNFSEVSNSYSYLQIITKVGVDGNELAAKLEKFFEPYYRNNRNYEVTSMTLESMTEMLTTMLSTITIAISVIAGIALLVGGIGVMNIMLVSITERTREIGTRKALGAKNASIRMQFIVESIIICLIGGIFGVMLGIGGGTLASKLLGYPAKPSLAAICISLGFSMSIGIFFGYYPANKAAKMNPIDALRYE